MLGELMWATMRGLIYGVIFAMVIAAFGLLNVTGFLLLIPVALLTAWMFAAVGMMFTTFIKVIDLYGWRCWPPYSPWAPSGGCGAAWCGSPAGWRKSAPCATSPRRSTVMTRLVKCAKLGQELPGLPFPPFKGELGQRIYNTISEQAWKQWLGHSTMVINENRLNPSEPAAQKVLQEQLEKFLFGGGAEKPAGYVPPKA